MWRRCDIPPPTAGGLACSPVCFLVINFPWPWPKAKKTFLSFPKLPVLIAFSPAGAGSVKSASAPEGTESCRRGVGGIAREGARTWFHGAWKGQAALFQEPLGQSGRKAGRKAVERKAVGCM